MKFILGLVTISAVSLFVYASGEIISKASQSKKGIETYLINKNL